MDGGNLVRPFLSWSSATPYKSGTDKAVPLSLKTGFLLCFGKLACEIPSELPDLPYHVSIFFG